MTEPMDADDWSVAVVGTGRHLQFGMHGRALAVHVDDLVVIDARPGG